MCFIGGAQLTPMPNLPQPPLHFQKLGAINEHFYNGNNKNVQTQSNQMQSILIFQIVHKSLDFTLNSVPYQTVSVIHSYLKI